MTNASLVFSLPHWSHIITIHTYLTVIVSAISCQTNCIMELAVIVFIIFEVYLAGGEFAVHNGLFPYSCNILAVRAAANVCL